MTLTIAAFLFLFMFRHFAGPAFFYLLFYHWRPNLYAKVKIQSLVPSEEQVRSEKRWTLASAGIDILVFGLMITLYRAGLTKIYFRESDGVFYGIFSFMALMILQDFYFYLTHRVMHWPWFFKYVHSVHHRSVNPTPWSAFAVHPIEKLIELLFFPFVILIFPLHPMIIFLFILVSTFINVLGHAGFEFNWLKIRPDNLSWWAITSTFHNMHHQHVRCNYSLYFSIWDKLLGTEHPDYRARYMLLTLPATHRTD